MNFQNSYAENGFILLSKDGYTTMKKTQSKKDYCKRYCEKIKDALRKKEGELKKASREHEKYVCLEKYKERLQNDQTKSRVYSKQKKVESSQANQTTSLSSQGTSSEKSSQVSESVFGSKHYFYISIL